MYNNAEEEKLRQIYDSEDNEESVKFLVKSLNRSKRSVIGKLSKMGLYKKKPYQTKAGEAPITKKQMVVLIASALEYEYEQLEGLEKTPKRSLKCLYDRIIKDYS
jgi:hypothetical protein